MREIDVTCDNASDAEKDKIALKLIEDFQDYMIYVNEELVHVPSYK